MEIDQLFEPIAGPLHSQTALLLIRKDDPLLARQALHFLRMKACKGDIDAKIKLSTVFSSADELRAIKLDKKEAAVWARSVFDRRLSAALTSYYKHQQEDDAEHVGEDLLLALKVTEADANANYLAGILLVYGIGVDRDVKQGVDHFKRAHASGHNGAGMELAYVLKDGFKHPDLHDLQESLALYESVAIEAEKDEEGEAEAPKRKRQRGSQLRALTDLAQMHYEGSSSIPRNVDKAYRYARRVAEATGERYCQFIVGDLLLRGTETTHKDVTQALFWLKQSGEQGFGPAIEAMSRFYFEGCLDTGIDKDYEQAQQWCLVGDGLPPSGLGYCQTCLGDIYREGLGVPRDMFRSFEYYQKAASQQDEAPQNYARFMLGEMFSKGISGWPTNQVIAVEYYRQAANEDYKPAQERLEELQQMEERQALIESQHEQRRRQRSSWSFWSIFAGRQRKATVV